MLFIKLTTDFNKGGILVSRQGKRVCFWSCLLWIINPLTPFYCIYFEAYRLIYVNRNLWQLPNNGAIFSLISHDSLRSVVDSRQLTAGHSDRVGDLDESLQVCSLLTAILHLTVHCSFLCHSSLAVFISDPVNKSSENDHFFFM